MNLDQRPGIKRQSFIRLSSVLTWASLSFSNFVSPAHADIMNLNEYMPTRLQDATPIDAKSMDLQMSSNFNKASPQDHMIYRPDIRYGVTKKLQLEMESTFLSGGEEKDHGETMLGGLYQVNESDDLFPMLALNPLVTFPTGKKSGHFDFSQEFVLTSTLNGTSKDPRTQLHVNVTWGRQSELYIFGVSQLLHERAALVVDILHVEEDGEESNAFETGVHLGLGEEYYLSLGGGLGFGGKSQNWSGLVALEKQIDNIFR